MKQLQIKNVGEVYIGFDDNSAITVQKEEIIWVSLQKAEQLLEDFPKNWVKVQTELEANQQIKEPQKLKGRPKNDK
jgi:hypothetical protein